MPKGVEILTNDFHLVSGTPNGLFLFKIGVFRSFRSNNRWFPVVSDDFIISDSFRWFQMVCSFGWFQVIPPFIKYHIFYIGFN